MFYADFPTDITVYPQEYTLHCVKTGFSRYNFMMKIGNTAMANYTGCDDFCDSICPDSILLHGNNHTIEHNFNITWDGVTIYSGSYSQPFIGDQDYQCIVSVIDQTHRIRNMTIQGKMCFEILNNNFFSSSNCSFDASSSQQNSYHYHCQLDCT